MLPLGSDDQRFYAELQQLAPLAKLLPKYHVRCTILSKHGAVVFICAIKGAA